MSGDRSRQAAHDAWIGVLDGIASLVDKSLVRQVETADGEPRFVMLETIREFGLEQLAASGEKRSRRAGGRPPGAWRWPSSRMPSLRHRQQRQWLARLEAEHDNLRAVLAWALERGEAETAQRLVGHLGGSGSSAAT